MKNFWYFINKPFMIWFLSTVTVSLVGFFYQKTEERILAQRIKTEKINAIDLEISSRLKFFFLNRENNVLIDDALLILDNPNEFVYPTGVYENYSSRNMRSLISELNSLVPEEEKKILVEPLNATYDLAEIYLVYNKMYRSKPTVKMKFTLLERLNETIITNFNLDRWKKPTNLQFPDLKKLSLDNYLQKALEDFSSKFDNSWLEEELRIELDSLTNN